MAGKYSLPFARIARRRVRLQRNGRRHRRQLLRRHHPRRQRQRRHGLQVHSVSWSRFLCATNRGRPTLCARFKGWAPHLDTRVYLSLLEPYLTCGASMSIPVHWRFTERNFPRTDRACCGAKSNVPIIRVDRYTGPFIVTPQFFGRRSAHFRIASSAGQRDCPHLVNRYSTFGGTWGYAVRCTMPSASMLFNCCPNIFCVMLGIARSRSEKRITLPPKR